MDKETTEESKSDSEISRELGRIVKSHLNLGINSEHWVDVTHILDPDNFHVRLVGYRNYLAYLEAPERFIDISDLRFQTPVVFMSKIKKQYIRGEVCYMENPTSDVHIHAVDYGFVENVDISNIFKPRHDYRIPPLAIQCQLSNCNPKKSKWDSEAIDAMKLFVGNEQAKIIINGNTNCKYSVELINSCPDDIAMMLVKIDLASFGCPNNTVNQFSVPRAVKQYFTFKTFHQGDVLHVRTLSGASLDQFYVAEIADYQEYLMDRENVSVFSRQSQTLFEEDLKVGNPVCVQNLSYNRYERSIVKEIKDGEKAIVQCVDTGSVREASLLLMKKVPQKLYRQPAVAIFCSSDKRQRLDYRFYKFLQPGQEFIVTIQESGEKFDVPYVVEIMEIGKKKK